MQITGGVVESRTDAKEEFKNVSPHAEEGDSDKEVGRCRGQRTKKLHSIM